MGNAYVVDKTSDILKYFLACEEGGEGFFRASRTPPGSATAFLPILPPLGRPHGLTLICVCVFITIAAFYSPIPTK